jgi:hypothetical protein
MYYYKENSTISYNWSNYSVVLPKGTVYYLHYGQYGVSTSSSDTSKIKSVKLTYISKEDFKIGKDINLFTTTFDGVIGQGTGDTEKYVVDDNTSDHNFRYISNSVNNYIYLGNERYRIIGVFNTKDRNDNSDRRIKVLNRVLLVAGPDFFN